jgi:hypothetical protein
MVSTIESPHGSKTVDSPAIVDALNSAPRTHKLNSET